MTNFTRHIADDDFRDSTMTSEETNMTSNNVLYGYIAAVGAPSLAAVAVLFNAVTLFVMCVFCGHLKNHYVLVVVQCVADLFASLCSLVFYLIPNNGLFVTSPIRHDYQYCIVRCLVDLMNAAFVLSLLNLLAITIDRLLAVHVPLRYSSIARTSRVKFVAMAIAMMSLTVVYVPFSTAVSQHMSSNGTQSLCLQYYMSIYFGVEMGKCLIALDTVVMVVVYSYILHQVHKSTVAHDNVISMYRTTMTSLWIITAFMICYWPDVISGHVDMPIPVHYIIKALPLLNCIMDPIIYAIRLRKIRNGFKTCFSRIGFKTQGDQTKPTPKFL